MRKPVILLSLILLVAGCAQTRTTDTSESGDAERGAQIFRTGVNGAPPCSTCHQVVEGAFGFSIGPNLAGVAERARKRVEGLAAADYLNQSILNPHEYLVSGYRDIMYPDYSEHFTKQDTADLIAYLLTL
jgi:cytochrome c2